ncbi:hypothetical protein [Escherichia coli]|uniref:hypothetical protein n=1 Tax=Escherichia coli TaxID=562 RepID=UPI00388EC6E6
MIRYEGPERRPPGMQEMLYPTSFLKSMGSVALRADHRRTLLRRHLWSFPSPRPAGSGKRRQHWSD